MVNDTPTNAFARWRYFALAAVIYAIAFAASGALRPDLRRDETHFWPTSLLFSESVVPSLDTLRDYGELATPLVFMMFGWLELLLGGGVVAGRALTAVVSLVIVVAIALREGRPAMTHALAVAGLMLYPYYLGVSFHLYTDVIAAGFALGGSRGGDNVVRAIPAVGECELWHRRDGLPRRVCAGGFPRLSAHGGLLPLRDTRLLAVQAFESDQRARLRQRRVDAEGSFRLGQVRAAAVSCALVHAGCV